MKTSLASFAEGISKLGLTEVGYAIALLWYFDQEQGRSELRPAYLAELMHDLSLRRRVNVTRLGRQLLANRDVMRGREMAPSGCALSASHASHRATTKLQGMPPRPQPTRKSFLRGCS